MNVHLRQHSGEQPYVCAMCGRRTKQASNLRSHYRHFHKNTEISGRQIRLNSRVFARYTQDQLDEHLRVAGDLMALLAKGMEEYQAEENARSEAQEQLLERLGLNESRAPPPESPIKLNNSDKAKLSPALGFNDVLDQFQMEQGSDSKLNAAIKNEDEYDISAPLPDDIIYQSLVDFDEKPPLPLLPTQELKIESVFIDVFTGEPSSLLVPEIKTEKIEYEYDQELADAPSNDSGTEYLWNTNQSDDISNEGLVPVEPEVTVVVEQNNDVDLSHEFDWNANDSSDSLPSIDNKRQSDAPKENTQKSKKTSKKIKTTEKIAKKTSIPVYNPRKSMCYVCGVEYKNRDSHLQSYHPDIQRPYECFICHRDYKKLYAVRQHMMTHSNARNTICHICGNAYFNNSDLKKHILSAHTTGKNLLCSHLIVIITVPTVFFQSVLTNAELVQKHSKHIMECWCMNDRTVELNHLGVTCVWNHFRQ